VLIVFLLLVNNESVSVLECILSATVKILDNLGPLLRTLILFDAFQELNVLFRFPGSFLKVWIEVAVPVLSALLGIPENFILSIVQKVKPLGDHLPVLGVLTLSREIFV
jgi:hypothetical protein